jgi:hypothetical protein
MTRLVLTAAFVAGTAFLGTGVASANVLAGKCPDGYYGVVVDDHDVCTNLIPILRCEQWIDARGTLFCP